MSKWRLRTKFLIAMLLISAGLTAVSLLIVQHTVASHVRRSLDSDLADSVATFRSLQVEREHPATGGWILDERGVLRRHINVFVNGEMGAQDTAVGADDRVDVLPAISGG